MNDLQFAIIVAGISIGYSLLLLIAVLHTSISSRRTALRLEETNRLLERVIGRLPKPPADY